MGATNSTLPPSGTTAPVPAASSDPQLPEIPVATICDGRFGMVALCKGQMEAEILQRVLGSRIFTCTQDELVEYGFLKCVDYPHLLGHIYYEGYFHALEQNTPFDSIHSRYGHVYRKPPAPRVLRALVCAFRNKNKARFVTLADDIRSIDPSNESLKKLSELFCSERMVADLSIQVHFGDCVGYSDVGWHIDSFNSMFHVAISIRGSRNLLANLKTNDASGFNEAQIPMTAGDYYISNPHYFRHGVTFPEATWDDRSVAVQARFLLEEKDFVFFQESAKYHEAVSEQIACALVDGSIVFPSLSEVLEVEEGIGEFDEKYDVQSNYVPRSK